MVIRRTKKTTTRKTASKKQEMAVFPTEYKQGIIAILFLFLAVLAVITDTKSVF
jgi:hypothetical protein